MKSECFCDNLLLVYLPRARLGGSGGGGGGEETFSVFESSCHLLLTTSLTTQR